MGIKNWLKKKVVDHKLKNVPESQKQMILYLNDNHPELMKKISEEIEAKKKAGQEETLATFSVMRKYQSEIQQALQNAK